ncbi:MAG: 16S rRNA (guanine(966)-N(2))-methyltransferase RsmD [Thiohalocapsa sp.]|uniref:16S rRNA (guanine(966)-N(2))-methyltransferase RsmD n=1 Tax=Thiohalocapsa sp. TaxID=2497641 RepID=UPI0025CFCDD4|nr:16S rRNA (guanine(966)-N(2))-methyltransferase RsmD [Thiohalocapsa sp.]
MAHRGGAGQLRIIGGRLRGRRLPVPQQPGLRPTTDRVRETLFNWLAADIPGSRCLDCFAGAGALGFEAFSRGAGEVWLIEQAPGVAARLCANAETLRTAAAQDRQMPAARLEVVQADALRWLASHPPAPFDIVFLDPPFRDSVISEACGRLAAGWLAPGAAVYIETPSNEPMPALPTHWQVVRERTAGQVRYALARAASE